MPSQSTGEQRTPRTLTGLGPRQGIPADPSTSRLRREHRQNSATRTPSPPAAFDDTSVVTPPTQPSAEARGGQSDLPRYLQLVRKESRLRQDQADRLTSEVRRLNQARRGRTGTTGERITDNTLIRVAVDLLLSKAGQLHGATEDELRKSVTP